MSKYKYLDAQQSILQSVSDGRFQPGSRIPAERELADSLNVSYMTLRRAVSELVEQGILERRQGKGVYVANQNGGTSVAMIHFRLDSVDPGSLAGDELETMRIAAASNHVQLRSIGLFEPFPSVAQLLDELRQINAGAAGLLNFKERDREYVRALSAVTPCVLLNKGMPGISLPCSKPDAGQGARLAVDYFANKGRKRIAVAVSSIENSMARELLIAIEYEMMRRGLPVDKSLWLEGSGENNSTEVFPGLEMLMEKNNFDAIMILNVELAYYLQGILARSSRKKPEDFDVMFRCTASFEEGMLHPWARLVMDYSKVATGAEKLMHEIIARGRDEVGAPVVTTPFELVVPK